eukprot:scaffold9890_cov91-Isochrysis_galbana.AAC.1
MFESLAVPALTAMYPSPCLPVNRPHPACHLPAVRPLSRQVGTRCVWVRFAQPCRKHRALGRRTRPSRGRLAAAGRGPGTPPTLPSPPAARFPLHAYTAALWRRCWPGMLRVSGFPDPDAPVWVCAPHTGIADPYLFLALGAPRPVMIASYAKLPVLGALMPLPPTPRNECAPPEQM